MRIQFIQDIIDRIRGKKAFSFHYNFLEELYLKYENLQFSKNKVDTICLGSSHGARGFIPQDYSANAFNLASTSQDLYYSFHLLKYAITNCPHLKHVFLFFSVFSNGFNLQKTRDKEICSYFSLLFGTPYLYEPNLELKKAYIQSKKLISNITKIIRTNGFIKASEFLDASTNITQRAESHLKNNLRENNLLEYLDKIIQECQKNKIQLTIIIPPIRKDFRQALPDKNLLFKNIYAKKDSLEILDYYDSSFFSFADFGDSDHLNYIGAAKLTDKILEEKSSGNN